MISYEELCQALDRWNGRLRNEAEMARLDAVEEEPPAAAPPPADEYADVQAATVVAYGDELEEAAPAGGTDSSLYLLDPGSVQVDVVVGDDQTAPPDTTQEFDIDTDDVVEELVDVRDPRPDEE